MAANSKGPKSYQNINSSQRNTDSRSNSNQQGLGERRTFSSNKNKFDFDNSNKNDSKDSEKWKSGYIFNQYNRKQQRNDPWWMRDEERNNPRIEPQYIPWWFINPVSSNAQDFKSPSWKIADLRLEADKRNIPHIGFKKSDLASVLQRSNEIYDLSDNNFKESVFLPPNPNLPLPACYPDSYEGSQENIAALRKRIVLVPPSGSGSSSGV